MSGLRFERILLRLGDEVHHFGTEAALHTIRRNVARIESVCVKLYDRSQSPLIVQRLLGGLGMLQIILVSTLPYRAYAQYQTNANPFSVSLPTPTVNNFTFTSTKQNQSYTCSNGGGSAPAIFAGVFSGVDKNTTNDLTEDVGSNSYSRAITSFPGGAAAGAGFIIPFNPPGMGGQDCRKIIGLLEAQEMINTLGLLKQAGAISNDEYLKRLKAIDSSLWGKSSISSVSMTSGSSRESQ